MFSLNNTVFATTSTDPVYGLLKTQIVFPYPQTLLNSPQMQNNSVQQQLSTPPTARAVRHILTQRTFYPVFPPYNSSFSGGGSGNSTTSALTGVPFDLAYLSLTETINTLPDVLLLPSQLEAFAKIIDGVVAVNPGLVCKNNGYATFAELWIKEKSVEDEDGAANQEPNFDSQGEQVVPLNVWKRTRVELIRV